MAEVLVTPDVEAAIVTFLRPALAAQGIPGVKVATSIPNPLTVPLVRIILTGGFDQNVVTDVVQVTFECHAATEVAASELARKAFALMRAAAGTVVGGVWIRAADTVGIGMPQNLPDPDTGKPRYVFTIRWHVRPA